MDLNWASPWNEETNTNTPLSPLQAAVLAPFRDNHAAPWGIAEHEWVSNIPNEWTFNVERERNLSETSAWGTSDDPSRKDDGPQNLFNSKPPTSSVPISARQPSPDLWTASSRNNDRAPNENDQVGLTHYEEPQKRESLKFDHVIIPDPNQDSKPVPHNSNSVLGDLEGEDAGSNIHPHLPNDQPATNLGGDTSIQDINIDARSSRPSSSLSHHGDELTESSRTSFEQESTQDSSRVKNLVLHFDRLATDVEETPVATKKGSLSEIRKTSVIGQAESLEADIDDFGDFEEETQESKFQVFEILLNKADRDKKTVAIGDLGLSFSVEPHLLETFLSNICPMHEDAEYQDSVPNEDVFTTIEERKLWHRISRYGTMRKHNSGNDENYRRVKFADAKIRDETLRIVSRWRTEDSINGRVVLGGGNRGSIFGWDDKDKRNSGPINMSEIWAERSVKHRSIPLLTSSNTSMKSPPLMISPGSLPDAKRPREPAANFGWNTENENVTEKSNDLSPLNSPPLFLLNPPPISSSAISPPSRPPQGLSFSRPTSMDLSRHHRVTSTKDLGHQSARPLDQDIPRPVNIPESMSIPQSVPSPVVPQIKNVLSVPKPEESRSFGSSYQASNDDEDWGDMVSSTPDLDAVLVSPVKASEECQGLRNRAESAPHPPPLDRVSQVKRPTSMQVGVLPLSSLADFAGFDESVVNLGDSEVQKVEDGQLKDVLLVQGPIIEASTLPIANHITTMPKLSDITDDFNVWGDEPVSVTTKERDIDASSAAVIYPVLVLEPSEHVTVAINKPSLDDFTSHESKKNSGTTTPETSSTSLNSYLSPISTSVANGMDGWANTDFSFFEKADPAPTLVKNPFEKELPKAQKLVERDNETASNFGSLSHSAAKEPNVNLEEEQIVKSIISRLPDLSYMFN